MVRGPTKPYQLASVVADGCGVGGGAVEAAGADVGDGSGPDHTLCGRGVAARQQRRADFRRGVVLHLRGTQSGGQRVYDRSRLSASMLF